MMPCCEECRFCGRHIDIARIDQHEEGCEVEAREYFRWSLEQSNSEENRSALEDFESTWRTYLEIRAVLMREKAMREFRKLESLSDILSLIVDHDGDLESCEVIESVAQLMYVNDTSLAQGAAMFLVSSCGSDGIMAVRRHLAIKDPGEQVSGVLELRFCTCPDRIGQNDRFGTTEGYTVDRTCIHHGDK